MQDFANLTATELVAGLGQGRWRSVDLTRHFLERIKSENAKVHAVPFVFETEALAQAEASDVRRLTGKPLSALDGLPMTMKDAIRVKGLPSTYGFWPLRNYHPKSDAKLIEILREGGVIFIGRTAVPTGAFDWNCANQVYAECVNPYDPTRTPGGSSGGAAAALALGMTPLELGSDLGGSIRYPCHCCGVFGLRTTDGWLPLAGVGPETAPAGMTQLVTFGPMARTAEDLDLLLGLYAEKYPQAKKPMPSKLKIAYSRDILGVATDDETKALLDNFLKRLQRHDVIEGQPDVDFEQLFQNWGMIAGHEFISSYPAALKTPFVKNAFAWWMLDRRLGPGPATDYFKKGILSSDEDYQAACALRQTTLRKVDEFFARYDLWILPVAPSAAFPLNMSGKEFSTPQGPISYSGYIGAYTMPTTALGTPALSYPIGKTQAGLPIGVQIHGARFADRWLTEVARTLEA